MRIAVKIGTSNLTHATGRINIRHVEELCKVLSDIKNAGHELVLVSSGAIGMGVGKMNLGKRPEDMPSRQALAAIGQVELMDVYDRLFSQYSHVPAQILLTGEDLRDEIRLGNFENTMRRLLEFNTIPIINENDTIATEEIAVGDNDTLSAYVAAAIDADLLIIMTDIDGLYTADPKKDPDAELIPIVTELTDEILTVAGGKGSGLSTGGMTTKLAAARICMDAGIDMLIINGAKPSLLYDAAEGQPVGTRFVGKKS